MIVGKEFDKIVIDSSKDVLVVFHAPWCVHSMKLLPILDDLASDMSSYTNLVISKLDLTSNEVDGLQNIKTYPTVMFYPKDHKTGLKYEGVKELTEMKEYLNQYYNESKDKS